MAQPGQSDTSISRCTTQSQGYNPERKQTGIFHCEKKCKTQSKLELCLYPWIQELREPTKLVVFDPLIPQGAETLKTFIGPYPSYPVLQFGHVLAITN